MPDAYITYPPRTSVQLFYINTPPPVSQRIWTPPRIWTPRSKSASGYGPPGPNPADPNPLGHRPNGWGGGVGVRRGNDDRQTYIPLKEDKNLNWFSQAMD